MTEQDRSWYTSGSSWLKVTPFGIRKMMNYIKNNYGVNLPIYITENGVSDLQGNLDDLQRIYYYKHYLNQLLKGEERECHPHATSSHFSFLLTAIKLDQCKVQGYFAWSLLDNFEWARGYSERFGLHFVNFTDPLRGRQAKASSQYFGRFIRDNGFVDNGVPCK